MADLSRPAAWLLNPIPYGGSVMQMTFERPTKGASSGCCGRIRIEPADSLSGCPDGPRSCDELQALWSSCTSSTCLSLPAACTSCSVIRPCIDRCVSRVSPAPKTRSPASASLSLFQPVKPQSKPQSSPETTFDSSTATRFPSGGHSKSSLFLKMSCLIVSHLVLTTCGSVSTKSTFDRVGSISRQSPW